MDFAIPQSLKDTIIAGKTVPFVGAGLSMTVLRKDSDEKLFCSWHDLLLESAEKLEQEHKTDDAALIRAELKRNREGAYYRAAQIAIDGLSQKAFNDFLCEKFDKQQGEAEPSSLDTAKLVWQLNSQLVVTTNYDNVLQWASQSTTRQGTDTKSVNISNNNKLKKLCEQDPSLKTVLHLHGSIENVDEIVLTPDSYQALYGDEHVKAQHQAALKTLQILLTRKTLIFIGFSFADQTFYNQIKLINDIFEGNSQKHFVLCRESQKADIDRLDLPLETICYKEYEDLPKLLEQLSQIATQKTISEEKAPKEKEPPINTPKPNLDNNVFFVPFRAKGKNVIGREQTLQELREKLDSGQQTNIGHATGFKGMGGVGKTQLAIEYAYNYKNEYPKGVIWLTADQDINSQLIACAKQANWVAHSIEDKDALAIAIRRLKSHSECLIIFDNVEALEDIEPFLPNNNVNPHLLLTSRNFIEGFEALDLDSLKSDDALALLCNEAGKSLTDLKAENGQQEYNAANKLCQQLGQLPLAIEIAGAHIKRRSRYTFTKYLDTFEQNFARATADVKLASFTKHEQCLISTLKLSDEIIREYPTLIKVMQILAYSANAAMGEELLSFMLYGEKHEELPDEFEESLDIGVELNLITVSNEDSSTRYSLHRLVKRVQLELTPFEEDKLWCQNLADNLIEWFKEIKDGFEHLALYQLEQPHLEHWTTHAKKHHWRQQAALIWLQAYPYFHLGKYRKAKTLLEQAQNAHSSDLSIPEDELTAYLFNDLGSILSALGDYQKALDYCQKSLNLLLKLFGKQHKDVATSYSSLNSCYSYLGQYDKALSYCQKALELRLNLFDERHPDIANSYSDLDSSFRNLGHYDKALTYCQKALDLRLKIFGEHHPDVATSYNSLDSCYTHLGQYNKALSYCQKALVLRLKIFSEFHPDTATSYNNLSACHMYLNESNKALYYGQKALNILLRLFGEHHPYVATNYNNTSSFYQNLGQHDKALNYCQKALNLRIKLFGEHHPDVANSFLNMGSRYFSIKQYQTALTYEQKAFNLRKELLGLQHPKTLHCLKNKQQTLIALKRFQPAMTAINEYRQQLPKGHAFLKELNKLEKKLKIEANKNNSPLRTTGQTTRKKKRKRK